MYTCIYTYHSRVEPLQILKYLSLLLPARALLTVHLSASAHTVYTCTCTAHINFLHNLHGLILHVHVYRCITLANCMYIVIHVTGQGNNRLFHLHVHIIIIIYMYVFTCKMYNVHCTCKCTCMCM